MVERKSIVARILYPLSVFAVYVFLYLPIVVLVLFSFNKSSVSVKWTGFTLKWYTHMLRDPELIAAFKVSLVVAIWATVLSVAMGTAYVMASRFWRSGRQDLLFYPAIIFPEIILAIGLLVLFTGLNIPLGYPSLIVGHALIGLGFVIPVVRARVTELDPALTEASADLGASPWQTFRKITLPLLMPSLFVSSLLVFTISLDDFLIAFFCSSAQVQTLSVYVYTIAREGIDPSVNAISTCMLAASSAIVLLLCFMKVAEQVVPND